MSCSILIASWGGAGHLGPMLSAARQLAARGHRVRFISRPDAREIVEAAGFSIVIWRTTPEFSRIAKNDDWLPYGFDHLLFGPAAARAADTREEAERISTDVVICDSALFGGIVGAEAAGVPCVILSPTIYLRPLPGRPPLGSHLPAPSTAEEQARVDALNDRFVELISGWLPMLNEARASQGLAPLDHVLELFDRAERSLIAVSEAFDFPATYLPTNVRYIGPLLDEGHWAEPWESPWNSESSRPRVLVSFSTTQQEQATALQRVINAVSAAGLDGIATTGPALEGTTLQAPPNVTLRSSAPHDLVMKEVSVVIAHGGHGTVSRALRHGLPLLVMPMGRDQNDIGVRVEAHGAGIVLPPDASEAEIAEALGRLVNNPGYATAARRLAQAMAVEIEAQHLVHEVEAIAGAYAT
jgi:MGT family glycosyltransferase